MGLLMNLIILLMSGILVISSAITNDILVAVVCAVCGSLGMLASVLLLQTKGY